MSTERHDGRAKARCHFPDLDGLPHLLCSIHTALDVLVENLAEQGAEPELRNVRIDVTPDGSGASVVVSSPSREVGPPVFVEYAPAGVDQDPNEPMHLDDFAATASPTAEEVFADKGPTDRVWMRRRSEWIEVTR